MSKDQLFNELKALLETSIQVLDDKPEETPELTVKALWIKASGLAVSVEKAQGMDLPELGQEQEQVLRELVEQRKQNIPVAHLTGRQNFMGIELMSDSRALIPRKETEILGRKAGELAEAILAKQDKAQVMDVCCGAGNLGLSLASHQPRATVFCSDITPEAVALTKDNIAFLNLGQRVKAFQGDMMSAFESDEYYQQFDLIICNPPYIFSSKVPQMAKEISANEPAEAFDGGMLGIKIIQNLIRDAHRFLKPDGWVAFELGLGQGQLLLNLCERSGNYRNIDSALDQNGNVRVIFAQNASQSSK